MSRVSGPLRLVQPVRISQGRNGAVLQTDSGPIVLSGMTVLHASALLQALLCRPVDRALGPCTRAGCDCIACELCNVLVDVGVADEVSPSAEFTAQLDWLRLVFFDPRAALRRVRQSHVLLVGNGRTCSALAATLLRWGIGTVSVHSVDSPVSFSRATNVAAEFNAAGIPADIRFVQRDVAEADLRLYCANVTRFSDVALQNRLASRCRQRFLASLLTQHHWILGPLISPLPGGCSVCAWIRVTGDRSDRSPLSEFVAGTGLVVADGSSADAALVDDCAAAVAFEAFKVLAGGHREETINGMVLGGLGTRQRVECHVTACMAYCDTALAELG
jgi:hypothetical protein